MQRFAIHRYYSEMISKRSEIRKAFLINGYQDFNLRSEKGQVPILFSTEDQVYLATN